MNSKAQQIFKKGSTTYYVSSIFFPVEIREKVTTLYAYVRTIDDFVDALPADEKSFIKYKDATINKKSGINIVDHFLQLSDTYHFQREWIHAFLNSMELDLDKTTYKDFHELEAYMFGSANVIGYMMSSIMGLPEEAYAYAGLQGKAMQLMNFIRDIKEDYELGRIYIPQEDMNLFNVNSIIPKTKLEQEATIRLIQFEIKRYFKIQQEAEKGYKYIPKRYLIPIKTAARMYYWTAKKIYENPLLVFEKKLKPSKTRIVATIIKHSLSL